MFVCVHTCIVYDKSEALLHHDIAEIMLKLALNTNQLINLKKKQNFYNLIYMKNIHLVCDLILNLTPRNFISKDIENYNIFLPLIYFLIADQILM